MFNPCYKVSYSRLNLIEDSSYLTWPVPMITKIQVKAVNAKFNNHVYMSLVKKTLNEHNQETLAIFL